MNSTAALKAMYSTDMKGTSFSVTEPIERIPPSTTNAASAAVTAPVSILGAAKTVCAASASVLICVRFPTPRAEIMQSAANNIAGFFQPIDSI
jgi:hypothetical protein